MRRISQTNASAQMSLARGQNLQGFKLSFPIFSNSRFTQGSRFHILQLAFPSASLSLPSFPFTLKLSWGSTFSEQGRINELERGQESQFQIAFVASTWAIRVCGGEACLPLTLSVRCSSTTRISWTWRHPKNLSSVSHPYERIRCVRQGKRAIPDSLHTEQWHPDPTVLAKDEQWGFLVAWQGKEEKGFWGLVIFTRSPSHIWIRNLGKH